MNRGSEKTGTFKRLIEYVLNLRDPSPAWRMQALAWGIVLALVVGTGIFFTFLTLYAIAGGGTITYEAKGSPGPVTFRHNMHMWFADGKYKDCKTCHDKLFATQEYGTYVLRTLKDSPERKFRIGKDFSTLYVREDSKDIPVSLVTYETQRACRTCATGNCHDGKESFSRLECLKCHQRR